MLFKKKFISKSLKSPNIYENRKKIFSSKNPNLIYLLEKRFRWMEKNSKKKILIE